MDPNANVDEQVQLAKEITELMDGAAATPQMHPRYAAMVIDKAMRLAELVDSLDCWITGGGALPARWKDVTRG